MTPTNDDATRLASESANTDETRLSSAPASGSKSGGGVTSSSGWLTSSDAIDHGRFPPGTVLGARYRIVGRLGRGGMGEVYRADDLKLAQPVALKFLPPEVDRDPARLMQLHNEVRMARQVSHPNVCRVYDIDEVEGHTFLSMEFVDGEELASLLRRIGRFSIERALELSRQICAGLAAAHERGVIHRDLKPANVMLDGTGKVRITDFGLAGVTGESIRAGTPAYMAPEQLAGGDVTAQSDIYALGLVLYELFTGQRAIEAKNVAELVRKREAGVVAPSEVVRELDPAIDRAILRCLERDPADRPSSALGVAAALPGGDPLAAALAAGETPSPEMVAAAGHVSALAALPAAAAMAATLILLAVFAALSDRALLTSYVPTDKPPEVLADRAREIARALGYTEAPLDTAQGFRQDHEYLGYALRNGFGGEIRQRLRSGRPPGLLFWHRSSPRRMIPTGNSDQVNLSDPPLTITEMRNTTLDTEGRLVQFHAVPPQLEDPVPQPPPRADWQKVFDLAGLDRSTFQPVAPQWMPRSQSDERVAWEGPMPGWTDRKVRIEAAAYRGRLIFFTMVNPWTEPGRMREPPQPRAQVWIQSITGVAVLAVLGIAVMVARHNLRKGRGDRRGAFTISAIVLGAMFFTWIVSATHIAVVNVELGRLFTAVGWSLFCAGAIWVLYLALEPYVRKFWPATVISWSRLLAGRWLDPLVGRDVLTGALFAVAAHVIGRLDFHIRPLLGYPALPPIVPRLNALEGVQEVLGMVGQVIFNAGFNSLWIIFGLVAINLLVRRVWITALVMTLFLTLTGIDDFATTPPVWLGVLTSVIGACLMVFVMLRFGLLATLSFFSVSFVVSWGIVTLDPSKWFFSTSTVQLLLVAGVAAYGFYASRGGEPLFGRRILD
jgi:tRNA A-37 threonylcarbamoyl transferase component Bud32